MTVDTASYAGAGCLIFNVYATQAEIVSHGPNYGSIIEIIDNSQFYSEPKIKFKLDANYDMFILGWS